VKEPPSPPQPTVATPKAPPRTTGFGALGPVTLQVWSYDGHSALGNVLEQLSKQFMALHPNVHVVIRFSDYTALAQSAGRVLASSASPDIVEGRQGYEVDDALVRAGLIVPLDRYAEAYGWTRWWGPAIASQLQFADSGEAFGGGSLYGVAPVGQSVLLFYNRKLLSQAGFDPAALPQTFLGFEPVLAAMRAALPRGQPVIELGDREGQGAAQLFGALQGVFADPGDSRSWVFHVQGSSFSTPGNRTALETMREWVASNYLNPDWATASYNQAIERFAAGTGVFLVAGSWEAPVILRGLGADAGVMTLPVGDSGHAATVGSTSGPYHITARSRHPDLAAAWLDYVVGSQDAQTALENAHLVPADVSAVPGGDPLTTTATQIWQQLDTGGAVVPYTTWASFGMPGTLSKVLRNLMAGRYTPAVTIRKVQSAWQLFQDELAAAR
jgi:raffinose/stachyose/melibiose transport system substrate-binding protein